MIFAFGDFKLDTESFELRRKGKVRPVEPKVFDLLRYLLENRARLISRDEIHETVWKGRIVSEATLSSCVNAARRAIGDSGKTQRFIKTVPRRGFRFVGTVAVLDAEEKPRQTTTAGNGNRRFGPVTEKLSLPDKPSIAVLPFANMSDDPDQEWLADGMTDDIITAVSKFRHFFVIARNSTFAYKNRSVPVARISRELGVRYVVEGSVRRLGDHIRANAQLIDALNDNHLWAERYDRDITDIFLVQDEITESIASAVGTEVYQDFMRRNASASHEELQAWETSMRALQHMTRYTPDGIAQAQILYRSVLERDPSNQFALRGLAAALTAPIWMGWAPIDARVLSEALQLAERAVNLDPRDAVAYCALATVHAAARDYAAANAAASEASKLNANLALAAFLNGATLAYLGRRDESMSELDRGSRLSPRDPFVITMVPIFRGQAEFFAGNIDAAAEYFDIACLVRPTPRLRIYQAAVAGLRGDLSGAQRALGEIKKMIPEASINALISVLEFPEQKDNERLRKGLRLAGLTESGGVDAR